MASVALRPLRGKDPLGLRRALADRLLPLLVAAMALLAALALGAVEGAEALAGRWRGAAGPEVTLALPPGEGADPAAALARLRALPEVAAAEALDAERLAPLLAPWLGEGPGGLPLPALIEVRPRDPAAHGFAERLAAALPGARVEATSPWVVRVLRLAEGMRALALAVLALVAGVAAALVVVAARAGIAARRETIVILHDLGARDGDIAGRFARRLAQLCAAGAALGALLSVPALHLLAEGAVPLVSAREAGWGDLPWGGLLALPPAAAAIGWLTAQVTVRRWLLRLP